MIETGRPMIAEPGRMTRLIRLKEVQHRVGLSRSTIYRWMASGDFPKPVRLSGYIVAWDEQVINDWIARHGVSESEV